MTIAWTAQVVCDCCGVRCPVVADTAGKARKDAARIGWRPYLVKDQDRCGTCLAHLQPCNRRRAKGGQTDG